MNNFSPIAKPRCSVFIYLIWYSDLLQLKIEIHLYNVINY